MRIKMKIWKSLLFSASLIAGVAFLSACGTASNTTVNVTVPKPANTVVVTNAATPAAANTAAPATETASGDSVGVAECDEYIKKYEACLTTIAAKAPQAAPGLRASFDAQRRAFKAAATTPQGKSALGSSCKQAIETAKTSTSQWCTW
jgi:hypothetical protein